MNNFDEQFDDKIQRSNLLPSSVDKNKINPKRSFVADSSQIYFSWENLNFSVPIKKNDVFLMNEYEK